MTKKTQGAIAAGHEKTAAAGKIMFELGGNAFDAAAAAILAAFVTEPGLTSAGGGGFLLAHTYDHKNILFDFFTQTPRHKKPASEVNFYPVDVDFGGAIQEFHIGLGSIAVPGNIAGVFHFHKKLGKLPLKVVIEPALDYAKNGVKIDKFQAYCFTILKHILMGAETPKKIYAPQGKLLEYGDILYMPNFANTLEYLADQGIEEFYQGEIANLIVKNCQEQGGYLTLEDLQNYRVIERKPLTITYRDRTLLTNPPPSSGGTLIAFALKMLETIDLSNFKFGSSKHLQILAEIMRLTNEARQDNYDINVYQDNIAAEFLATAHLQPYIQQLTGIVNKWGSTTHISTMDAEGNAASITSSNGEGSSYMIPGTSIMLNNMLGEEDLNPQGFYNWPENRRISSMMSPTIVLNNNQPEIVIGSGGSKRIRTAILQVISNLIDFNMSVDIAVDSPRIHWENNIFSIEPGLDEAEVKKLVVTDTNEVVLWQEKNMFFGGVHTVIKNKNGELEGAGDGRRNGAIAL